MPKRILQGTVVSDKGDKTIVVSVERRFADPVMKKTVRKSKRYHAHDAQNTVKVGDKVAIRECRPSASSRCREITCIDTRCIASRRRTIDHENV